MPNSDIRVLIVEDHPIFRLGLSSRIESMGGNVQLVGQAADGIEALPLVDTLKPNVILMDLNMPRMSGIEATRKIKQSFPEVQIIILSADDEINDINLALQAGASGYLLKSVSGEDLQQSISMVMNGDSVLSPSVAKRLLFILRKPSVVEAVLSDREVQILELVASGATNKKISLELFLSIRTIETHVHHIFQKLGVTSRTEAVTTAIRKQLIQNG